MDARQLAEKIGKEHILPKGHLWVNEIDSLEALINSHVEAKTKEALEILGNAERIQDECGGGWKGRVEGYKLTPKQMTDLKAALKDNAGKEGK